MRLRSVTGDGRAAEHPGTRSEIHAACSQTGHVSDEKRARKAKNEVLLSLNERQDEQERTGKG